jgi:hypothetical protein
VPLDLAALLVEAGAASANGLERALERQREAGGSLDTALLELGLVTEGELIRLLSRASDLPPPPAEPIEPDPRARRVFPARVAERHGLAPFRLQGRELSLLATHPVDLGAVDEISFMLSLHLVPHVAPEWRVRELMARVYGGELPERLAAVAKAVRSAAVSAPSPTAPASHGSRSPEAAAERGGGDRDATPTPAATSDTTLTFAAFPTGPLPSFPAAGGQAAGRREGNLDDLVISIDEGFSLEPGAAPPGTPAHQAGPELPLTRAAPAVRATARPAVAAPGPLGASRTEHDEPLAVALAQAIEATDAEALLHDPAALPPPGDTPPHWSREDAFAALEAASTRDDVVAVALRYARDFFEVAALFAVTRERVSGQDAVGWEDARARCRTVQVPPDAAGLFRAAIETSGPYLGPVANEPGNEAILTALARPWPRIALVYPVALRDRTVCILYADNGDAPVSPRRLGDLLLLAGGMGGAFERILREAKRIRAIAPPLGGGAQGQPDESAAATATSTFEATPSSSTTTDDWEMKEPARAPEPGPALLPGMPDPFQVASAAEALPSPGAFDPAEAVLSLRSTRRGSAERGRLIAQIVQHGPDAAAALCAAFPGLLDVAETDAEALPVEERGPVLAALAALGIVATPYLTGLLLEPDAQRRRLAALLLGGTRDPAAFLPLADRVLDPDPGVAEAALGVLARLHSDPNFRPVLERLRRALLGNESERPAQAATALARLGDAEAVPLLIQALDAPDLVGNAAAGALAALTCQHFGRDARLWLTWWKDHRTQGRVDWLFAALADDDREVRATAAEALREGGTPPVPWLTDASPAQRSEAARAWRAWWNERSEALSLHHHDDRGSGEP